MHFYKYIPNLNKFLAITDIYCYVSDNMNVTSVTQFKHFLNLKKIQLFSCIANMLHQKFKMFHNFCCATFGYILTSLNFLSLT